MARFCFVTKKKPLVGNKVSHAKNRTKRRFLPNIHNVSFWSVALAQKIQLPMTAAGIRCIEKKGGLDEYMASAKLCEATPKRVILAQKKILAALKESSDSLESIQLSSTE